MIFISDINHDTPYYIGDSVAQRACIESTEKMNVAHQLLFQSTWIKTKFHTNVLFMPQQILQSLQNGAYGENKRVNKWVLDKTIQPDTWIQKQNMTNKSNRDALILCALYGNSSQNATIIKAPAMLDPFKEFLEDNEYKIRVIGISEGVKELKELHDKLYKEKTGMDFA